ncbi:spore germination protein [Neobacillus sp. PS3-40]|uniref:spore germination protein n=1 Tax=Neobacillus sp. PS3-40 TaxID=3070679 RepID=UPI0027E14194|nr:spore germination protein [Neobacillus sp. PS3-40]WML44218.1 spore germination protein [Neobacillus sp. PS3-40]
MSILSKLFKKQQKPNQDNYRQKQDPTKPEELPIQRDYMDNITRIKEELGNSTDVAFREFFLQNYKGVAVYIDGLANNKMISDFFMESLLKKQEEIHSDSFQYIVDKVTSLGNIKIISNWDQVYEALLSGNTLFFIGGYTKAINVETKGWDKRAITEPSTQLSIRGPKDSFIETLRTNTALIRRRIKSPNLWLEMMQIGTVTQTDVGIMYIKGIVNEKIVTEVKQRLSRINMDSILDSGYIEQLIEDQTMTSFPTIYHTERPDVVSSQLLEGRVAIFVDGSPFVLTAPAVFIQFFQAADDYYARFDIATGIRLLRLLSFFIALVGPALYIAVTTFHQEMIPTTMVIAIAAQRENVPFPAFVEALIMEITFEILREAGLRLPRAVGQAVSIVGALVIGQAAVQAGFVSPVMVIVVATTAIANFSTPSFAMAISARLLRFVLMGLSTFLGFYGIMLGVMFMTIHLCSLRSFGVPYMAPLAPFNFMHQQDALVRFPVWALKNRPELISKGNLRRTGPDQRPEPPKQNDEVATGSKKGDQS